MRTLLRRARMTDMTQGLGLLLLGAVLVRVSVEGAHLRYVVDWMRWPLLVTGVMLAGLALRPLLQGDPHEDTGHGDHAGHHGVPTLTWLMLLPVLVVFVVSPPALGAYLAERRDTAAVEPPADSAFEALPAGEVSPLDLDEFAWRAYEGGETLVDRDVALRGFVSVGPDGSWYVTRMSIGCCAADATAMRVGVDGVDAPPRNSWVEVIGTWVDGTGTTGGERGAFLAAQEVRTVDAPDSTYQ